MASAEMYYVSEKIQEKKYCGQDSFFVLSLKPACTQYNPIVGYDIFLFQKTIHFRDVKLIILSQPDLYIKHFVFFISTHLEFETPILHFSIIGLR